MQLKPKLRFAEYIDNWQEKVLVDCLDYERPDKYIVVSNQYNEQYNIPVLTANKGFVLGYTSETDGIYDKGDCIIFDDFTMDCKFVNFPYKIKSSAIKILTAKNDCNLRFLYEKLKLLNLKPVTHQRHYISYVQEMIISIPTLPEQTRIATMLNLHYKKCQLQKEKVERLGRAKDKITKVIYDNQNGETYKLGEICKITKGKQLSRIDMINDGEYKVYNGGIMHSGYTNNYNAYAKTITISEGGNSCGYVNYVQEKFWSGGHNYTINNPKMNPELLYYFLKLKEQEIMQLRIGSGLPNIQKKSLEKFEINVNSETQYQNLKILSLINQKLNLETKRLEELQKYKQGLLQKMFV